MGSWQEPRDEAPLQREVRLLARNHNYQQMIHGQNQKAIIIVGFLILAWQIVWTTVKIPELPPRVWVFLIVAGLGTVYAAYHVFAVIFPRGYVEGYTP